MRILVTGAGGFIGKRLTRRLAALGHDVYGVVRRTPPSQDEEYFASPRVTLLRQDLTRLDVANLPRDIEGLITLAQSSHFREFPQKAEEVFTVNVTANLKLLQWAAASNVQRVVHASSGGIYGGKKAGRLLETDSPAVDSPLGFYLGSKLCSEVIFQNYRHFFTTAIVLRPFFVYGPEQRKDMFVARLVDSVRKGQPISLQGKDGLRVNPIYVDDAVEAFCAALKLPGAHVINLAGPDILTLRQIGDAIGKTIGRKAVYEFRPGDPVDYVGDTAAAAEKLRPPAIGFEKGIALATRAAGTA